MSAEAARNPYARQGDEVREPPRTFPGKVRYLGPGLIVVASIVGSGELIATTALGSYVGFACLWLILLSCFSKTMMMEELGRFTISSGETAIRAFNQLPGPKWKRCQHQFGWFSYVWFLQAVPGIITSGGIIGGVGQVAQVALPLQPLFIGLPLKQLHPLSGDRQWALIIFALTILLINSGRYRLIEAVCTLMVLTFTAATIGCAIALQWTEFAVQWSDIAAGMRFDLPAGAVLLALGAYGGTGTTPNESMAYTYWCLEKGFARFAGRSDGTETWRQRARGWIAIMHLDVAIVMIIFTIATIAFYFLGAAVLKPMITSGAIPLEAGATILDGPQTMRSLSNMYTQTLGEWAKWLYLVGGFCVLYSTVVSGWAVGGRVWSDMLGVIGIIDTSDYKKRVQYTRLFNIVLPTLTTLAYLLTGKIVLLLAIGGTIGTLMTPIVGLATLYLRRRRTEPSIAPTRPGDLALHVSVALMVVVTPFAMWAAWGDMAAAWRWLMRLF